MIHSKIENFLLDFDLAFDNSFDANRRQYK